MVWQQLRIFLKNGVRVSELGKAGHWSLVSVDEEINDINFVVSTLAYPGHVLLREATTDQAREDLRCNYSEEKLLIC